MKKMKLGKSFKERNAIYLFFRTNHSTMYDAAEQIGITRPNITRHVSWLEKQNLIERTYTGICPISKQEGVWFFRKKNGF